MRILCNLPLERFDDRAAMRDIELCTFGPPDRMMVDGVHYAFDVAFDPSRGTWPADWSSIDGPTLPFGFDNSAVERSLALQQAIRTGSPAVFAAALTS
jgi:hypothetical protein